MSTEKIKNQENMEGRERQGQQSPSRNPRDEQSAGRYGEPETDRQRKSENKGEEHRERDKVL
jgi:hypothetical protein